MFQNFLKKIDSTVRETLGNNTPKSNTSPSNNNSQSNIIKANNAFKNISTKLKSSLTQRKIRDDEIGKEFVEIRMAPFVKACVNNRQLSLKSESLVKNSTAQCNALKKEKEKWENFENKLNDLQGVNEGIQQVALDIDEISNKLAEVENLLEEVCVLDISLQHLKWERKLENSIKTHKQKESVKLLRLKGEKRASNISKDISSNFSRLLRSTSIASSGAEEDETINSNKNSNATTKSNDTSTQNDNKTDRIKDVGNIEEACRTTSSNESEEEDEEFDPNALYNED